MRVWAQVSLEARGSGSLGAGVTGSCEPPNMSAGNQQPLGGKQMFPLKGSATDLIILVVTLEDRGHVLHLPDTEMEFRDSRVISKWLFKEKPRTPESLPQD